MARGSDPILRPKQSRYLERLRPPGDPLLREMEERSAALGVPSARPELGRLLAALAAIEPAGRLLEVGTGIGYGTLHLARGARHGRVVTIDVDAGRQAIAREYLDRAGVGGRVETILAPALEAIPRLAPPFQLVFLDALKTEYRRCLDLVLPLLAVGGRIVVDNLLWSGKVADPSLRPEAGDREADAIERFNPYFLSHPQLAAVILPLGDGVGLAVKTKTTILEMGGPF